MVCNRFQEIEPQGRRQAIVQVGAYTNCLAITHRVENCGSGRVHLRECFTAGATLLLRIHGSETSRPDSIFL